MTDVKYDLHNTNADNFPLFLSNARLQLASDIYADKERQWRVPSNLKTVTWRQQRLDPVFQFVQLVAGAANVNPFEFMYDDAEDENHVTQLLVLENYRRFLNDKCTDAKGLEHWTTVRVVPAGADGSRSSSPLYAESGQQLEKLVQEHQHQNRPIVIYCAHEKAAELRASVHRRVARYEAVVRDIDALHEAIRRVENKQPQTPWSHDGSVVHGAVQEIRRTTKTTEIDEKTNERKETTDAEVITNAAPAHHRLFFSNEINFKPPFQWALLMAQEKVNGKCGIVDLDARQKSQQLGKLMTDHRLRTIFGQTVALQYLLAKARNSRGEWQKDITYKRLVRSEHAAVRRMRTLLGHRRTNLLAGYEPAGLLDGYGC